jgi:hypothetical protein
MRITILIKNMLQLLSVALSIELGALQLVSLFFILFFFNIFKSVSRQELRMTDTTLNLMHLDIRPRKVTMTLIPFVGMRD